MSNTNMFEDHTLGTTTIMDIITLIMTIITAFLSLLASYAAAAVSRQKAVTLSIAWFWLVRLALENEDMILKDYMISENILKLIVNNMHK